MIHREEQATVRPPLLLDSQLLSAYAYQVLQVISQLNQRAFYTVSAWVIYAHSFPFICYMNEVLTQPPLPVALFQNAVNAKLKLRSIYGNAVKGVLHEEGGKKDDRGFRAFSRGFCPRYAH